MINLEIDSVKKSSNGTLTGNISFHLDSIFFPERDWNDRIFPIINLWGDEIIKFIDLTTDAELFFMDGPFNVKILANKGDSFIELKEGNRVIKSMQYDTQKLKNESIEGYLKVAQLLLTLLRDKKWFSDEANHLESNYRTLMNRM